MAREGKWLAKILLKKRWSVIVADEPGIGHFRQSGILDGPSDRNEGFGFGTRGMTVTFPLSPKMLLHLSDRENGEDDGLYCPLQGIA